MRHTVTSLFQTFGEAETARNALLQAGFAATDIGLRGPAAADTQSIGVAGEGGLLANIERFVASLFATGAQRYDGGDHPEQPEAVREALRRGAVLVRVEADSEAQAQLAAHTLAGLGALEVVERPPGWEERTERAVDPATAREHSVLDELGLRPVAVPRQQSVHATSPHGEAVSPAPPEPQAGSPAEAAAAAVPPEGSVRMSDDAAATAIASASAPGCGAVFPTAAPAAAPASELPGGTQLAREEEPPAGYEAAPPPGMRPAPDKAAPPIPDEYVEYEEDFRGHHAGQVERESQPFEDYESAYRYGVMIARDVRYVGRSWDEIEADARHGWETTFPADAWDKIRSAVRHGWERAGGNRAV